MFEIQYGLYQRYIDGSTALVFQNDSKTSGKVEQYNEALNKYQSNSCDTNWHRLYEIVWRLFEQTAHII